MKFSMKKNSVLDLPVRKKISNSITDLGLPHLD